MMVGAPSKDPVRVVYGLYHVITGEFYIGETTNVWCRSSAHFQGMASGRHPVKRIVELARTFGAHSFIFVILRERASRWTEYHLIRKLRPPLNRTGPDHPNGKKGKKYPEQAKKLKAIWDRPGYREQRIAWLKRIREAKKGRAKK